ncbi:MAG TPA: CinA family protein [Anaerolineae bacterium]|nr:CinA family protein [Anaerolineae bacterium]
MTSESLEELIGKLLTEKKLTLALGESCTGGLVAHRLTNVPGSSNYVLGGIIAYSNEAKERLLGVQHATLEEHGAVSGETAIEMAYGARAALGADVGLSVTGIAGPGGGTPEKPVGLVYVALSAGDWEQVERFVWSGSREENKAQSAEAALVMLRDYLSGRG